MAADRVERRLSAIFVADVAGYSRLMGADEEGTHARLNEHLSALLHPEIEKHGGRLIRSAGDGILVEFASVVGAMRCAVAIQRGMITRNSVVLIDQIDRRIEEEARSWQGVIDVPAQRLRPVFLTAGSTILGSG